ncbi:MAG: hypothetical protein H0W33_06875 [Gammaproteobacteria bacterium]|nr:hypothetical protein [Gammaproteobacteria bacterium]
MTGPLHTLQSETAPLASVLVKNVRDAWSGEAAVDAEWQSLGYAGRPARSRAQEEYDAFLALLGKDRELELIFAGPDRRTGLDSLYARDAALATDRGVILCNMGKAARRGEPAAMADVFENAGVPLLGAIEGEATLEGGDVAWLDTSSLAVGRSYRSNEAGIEQLRGLLGNAVEVIVADLPHWRGPSDILHLMSILSPLDENLALAYSPLLPIRFREELLARGIWIVEVAEEEFATQGCNVLALAPREALMVAGNPRTRDRLERAGVKVREFAGAEICIKGGGGPTCLTRPLRRGG